MALQNSNPESSSRPGQTSHNASSGVSLSRQKKIAIVLFLMLSGFFLIDDRPVPPPPGNEVQEFMDKLTYQSEEIAQASAVSGIPQRSDQQPLQLPGTQQPQNLHAAPNAASDVSPTNDLYSANGRSIERPDSVAPPRYRQVAQASRPTVKFTGQIEPLY